MEASAIVRPLSFRDLYILNVDTDRRDTYAALVAFSGGNDAGLLVIAPAPFVDRTRWCRWTPSPRLGIGGPDDLERLGLATMRVGYALGLADSGASRERDVIGREWFDRTLSRIVEPAGMKVVAVVALGPMTEAEIAGDRIALWERVQGARAESGSRRQAAMVQLEDALNEMGGIGVFDYSQDDDGQMVEPRGELLGTQHAGAANVRANTG